MLLSCQTKFAVVNTATSLITLKLIIDKNLLKILYEFINFYVNK